MTSLTISEAKSHLPELVRKADKRYESFIITRNGLPKAVIISYDELDGLLETIDIIRDRKLAKSLAKSLKEADRGQVVSFSKIRRK